MTISRKKQTKIFLLFSYLLRKKLIEFDMNFRATYVDIKKNVFTTDISLAGTKKILKELNINKYFDLKNIMVDNRDYVVKINILEDIPDQVLDENIKKFKIVPTDLLSKNMLLKSQITDDYEFYYIIEKTDNIIKYIDIDFRGEISFKQSSIKEWEVLNGYLQTYIKITNRKASFTKIFNKLFI